MAGGEHSGGDHDAQFSQGTIEKRRGEGAKRVLACTVRVMCVCRVYMYIPGIMYMDMNTQHGLVLSSF